MFKHILIPTEGSPLAQIAIDQGFALAKEAGAKVTVVTVSEPFHVIASDVEDIAAIAEEEFHRCEEAEHLLRDTQAHATAMGLDCEALLARAGRPDEAIIEIADKTGCDLIAMASHRRRSFVEMLLGSVTAKVLKNSKIPVLVYRQ